MGCYIDRLDREEWLASNGERTKEPCQITEESLPVCLINNGPFKAAAVCYSLGEVQAFTWTVRDPRPRVWFKVNRALLRKVSHLEAYE